MSPLTAYVVDTIITLLAIVLVAWLVLYVARRAGVRGGPLRLVGRLPLDGRRAVYLVRVGKTVYVVGASEAGLSKLGELEGDEIGELELDQPASSSFKQALARALGREPTPSNDK